MGTRTEIPNVAVTGVAGGVATRHLDAIVAVGGRIVAAMDPHDAVGVLDRFAPEAHFFLSTDSFERHIARLAKGPEDARLHYLSVCAPNDRHAEHCLLGLRHGADVVCEKPVVIDPAALDTLQAAEEASGRRVWTVLQLRTDDRLRALRLELGRGFHDVVLTYITPRGAWYDVSWKGDVARSGGIATNIGVHMFDLLLWLFGPLVESRLHLDTPRRMSGFLELERARVRWFLSVDEGDLPAAERAAGARMFRTLDVDGKTVEFSTGFTDLHRRVYREILDGAGNGLESARGSIELAHAVRTSRIVRPGTDAHPRIR